MSRHPLYLLYFIVVDFTTLKLLVRERKVLVSNTSSKQDNRGAPLGSMFES